MVSELLRIVETENSKRKKKSAAAAKAERAKQAEIAQDARTKVKSNREKKENGKEKGDGQGKEQAPARLYYWRPRTNERRQGRGQYRYVGEEKAIVNYGQFTTHVGLEQLELVEKKK